MKDPTEAKREAIEVINQIAAEMGLHRPSSRMKHKLLLFGIPRNWKGTRMHFGYSPWREPDGKFYTFKYRENRRTGQLSLLKKLGFAKRKTAAKRALKWYEKYYRDPERLAAQEIKMAAKRSKPKPTKLQLAEAKLLRIQANMKKMESKKKRLETLLKKRGKAVKHLTRRIEKLKGAERQ